mmetsp:Transcript_25067/g.37493  ORF Transcript_25067/g.37493 Transcript_25067/m.37493 type:complete len:190 (-) Transcript_25067:27-596(-)
MGRIRGRSSIFCFSNHFFCSICNGWQTYWLQRRQQYRKDKKKKFHKRSGSTVNDDDDNDDEDEEGATELEQLAEEAEIELEESEGRDDGTVSSTKKKKKENAKVNKQNKKMTKIMKKNQKKMKGINNVDVAKVKLKVRIAAKLVIATAKFRNGRDILIKSLAAQLRKERLKEFAGLAFEAGEVALDFFS